jgi:hypothetical protein
MHETALGRSIGVWQLCVRLLFFFLFARGICSEFSWEFLACASTMEAAVARASSSFVLLLLLLLLLPVPRGWFVLGCAMWLD